MSLMTRKTHKGLISKYKGANPGPRSARAPMYDLVLMIGVRQSLTLMPYD